MTTRWVGLLKDRPGLKTAGRQADEVILPALTDGEYHVPEGTIIDAVIFQDGRRDEPAIFLVE